MIRVFTLVLGVAASGLSLAADIADGKQRYMQTCIACHGAGGQGNESLGAPRLAAQQSSYLIRQLANFSDGLRGHEQDDSFGKQMAPMAAMLVDQAARENVAAYLQSLSSAADDRPSQKKTNGYKYYQGSCGACHGGAAEGNELLNSPRLAGMSAAYLKRQYQKFLSGQRGADPSDKFGRQMAMIASTFTDEEKLDDVLAYISSL